MSFFWGVIGVISSIFLPGAALTALIAKKPLSGAKFLTLAFIFSLTLNYLLSFLTIGAAIPNRPTFLGVTILALIILVILYLQGKFKILFSQTPDTPEVPLALLGENQELPGKNTEPKNINLNILYNLALLLGILMIVFFYRGFIFLSSDAISSWNGWALSWADNSYPKVFGDYPQLLPIIISLPYIFMGESVVQLFSILNLNYFILIGLLALATLKDTRYAWGGAISSLGLMWLVAITPIGYADAIIAFLGIISLVNLLWYQESLLEKKERRLFLYSAFLGAALTAVLKQAGLFFYIFFILIAIEFYLGLGSYSFQKIARSLLLPLGLSLPLAFVWYIYNKVQIYQGEVIPYTNFYLTEEALYKGRSFFGRAIYALFRYSYFTLFALAAIYGLKQKGLKMLSASALFIMLGWLLFFSYGSANVKFPVALTFFPLGAYLQKKLSREKAHNLQKNIITFFTFIKTKVFTNPLQFLLIFTLSLFIISFIFSDKINGKLVDFQKDKILDLGEIGITRRVNFLLTRNPKPLLSEDSRLMQLTSFLKGEIQTYLPEDLDTLKNFGYVIILSREYQEDVKAALDKDFSLDYREGAYLLFVRKDLLVNFP
ncbi:MAG: hypothetical protein LBF22_06430 [Deltaproteobacteria bacterium]|jgi:hypothetical protein|nr:hypothetical protein [Deltaproteobacteria bacterium]